MYPKTKKKTIDNFNTGFVLLYPVQAIATTAVFFSRYDEFLGRHITPLEFSIKENCSFVALIMLIMLRGFVLIKLF